MGIDVNTRTIGSRDEVGAKQPPVNHAIYVITGHGGLNDRVKKVVSLHIDGSCIVLIAPKVDGAACEAIVVNAYPNPTNILSLMKLPRLKRIIDSLLYFPTNRVLYVKPIEKILKRRIKNDHEKGRRVTLLVCVPPHDVCLVGLSLKKRFPQIKWLVDWQDLWSFDENYLSRTARPYRANLLRLERRILASCDLNITTNSYAKSVLESKFNVPADKLIAIPHHFCSDDLGVQAAGTEIRAGQVSHKTVRIGFLGTLFKPPRVPGALIHETLRDFKASGLNVEVHVHGNYPKHVTAEGLTRMLGDGLFFHGPSTHEESLRLLLSYDFLLLLLADMPNSRAVMSIKLPHYMLTGIPIIAIVPERSAVADAVRLTGTGFVVPVESDWRPQLKCIISGQGEPPMIRRDARQIDAYSWDNLLSKWKAVFACTASQPLRN
ncbi:MAG: hypothetical protein ACR2KU_06530 [Gammaproteobacteria bacterium]